MKVGSVITLNIAGREEQWTILGSGGRGFIPVAYVFYDDLASETGLDGLANRLVIQTTRSDSVFQSQVQSNVLARLEQINFDVLGSQTTTQLKETNAAQMDVLIVLLLAMVVLIAIVGGLGLAITMSLNVMERTREIGILRSLGRAKWSCPPRGHRGRIGDRSDQLGGVHSVFHSARDLAWQFIG